VPVHATDHVTSPMIRHLADELHVDPRRLRGTGPGGRVHRDDVEAAAHRTTRPRITPRARRLLGEHGIDPATLADQGYVSGDHVLAMAAEAATKPAAAPVAEVPAERPTRAETMRRHIAELMSRSWEEIPHFHVAKVLDLSAATDRLIIVNEDRSVSERLVPGALLLCAAARAAAKVHTCNGWWRDGGFEQADDVRLGMVLSLRTGGIIVPTIDAADQLSPADMMARLAELVQRARQGRLRASDLTEATITVTNLGDLGADSVAGVIHPPQVAIIGFGAVHDEVRPVDGCPTVGPVVHASLAGDHRAFDGLAGSRYLAQLQTLLDGPLLEEL
jgi:pyruvate dehydrogenase E2 component (dihydrolipoamide acetyltransferase)